MKENKKYYIVYQITNKLNNKIYIGVHVTENIKDKYMGSGSNIKKAIKEFGMENFEKIILFNCNSKEEMLEKERELVNDEFIKSGDTYNITLGGGEIHTINMVSIKDVNNNCFLVHKTDPRYLSGELVGVNVGMVITKDKYGNILRVSKNDKRYLSGELISHKTGKVCVIDEYNNYIYISTTNSRYLNGDFTSIIKGLVTVKDKNNNTSMVSIEDPRYLSGELIPIWVGKKHKEESIIKMSNTKKGKYKGEENSQFNTCWVYNLNIKESKKIKNDELDKWLSNGWIKGRKQKF